MIRLNQTASQFLSLITAQNGANVVVNYSDDSATGYPGDSQLTNIITATTTTICGTPAASTIRDIDHISIHNTFAGNHTLTLQVSSSAVLYPLHTFTLGNGDVFEYTHGIGYKILDSSGAVKSTGVFSSTTPLMNGVAAVGTEVAASRGDHVHPSDTTKMTVSVYDTDADGIVDNAESVSILGRNNTGVGMTKGQIVYVSGAVGQVATIALAKADAEATSAGTIGILTVDIPNNSNGNVAMMGRLQNFNTSAFTDGALLYLSPTVAGGMTSTKPVAPNQIVFIGYVTYSHATNGSISININNGWELNELHDVAIVTPATGNVLVYDSPTLLWKNSGYSFVGTAAQTYTLPTTTATIARTDAAQTFTGTQTFGAVNPTSINGVTTDSTTNKPITAASLDGGTLPVSATTVKAATTIGVGNATPSASGAGISFPATQSASTDPNTLDDYEEGTWSATLTAVTTPPTTPIVKTARYTKTGNVCTVEINFENVDTTGAVGDINISGLPFASSAGGTGYGISNGVVMFLGMGTAVLVSELAPSSTTMSLPNAATAAPAAIVAGAGKYIRITHTYFI